MSAEANKALIRRWIEEGWNNKNQDVIDDFFTADFIDHAYTDEVIGPAGVHKGIADIAAETPDARFTLDDIIAEGDKVVVRGEWAATHDREWKTPVGPLAPTGKRVTVNVMTSFRIADGKIAESWGVGDGIKMFQQLGALPVPEQAQEATA